MKRVLLIITILLASTALFATSNLGSIYDFIYDGYTGKSVLLGRTGVVSAQKDAVFYNPALLTRVKYPQMSVANSSALFDADYISGSINFPIKKVGVIGIGYIDYSANSKYFIKRDSFGNVSGNFSGGNTGLYLGIGREYKDFNIGITGHVIKQEVGDVSSSSFDLDAGIWKGFVKKSKKKEVIYNETAVKEEAKKGKRHGISKYLGFLSRAGKKAKDKAGNFYRKLENEIKNFDRDKHIIVGITARNILEKEADIGKSGAENMRVISAGGLANMNNFNFAVSYDFAAGDYSRFNAGIGYTFNKNFDIGIGVSDKDLSFGGSITFEDYSVYFTMIDGIDIDESIATIGLEWEIGKTKQEKINRYKEKMIQARIMFLRGEYSEAGKLYREAYSIYKDEDAKSWAQICDEKKKEIEKQDYERISKINNLLTKIKEEKDPQILLAYYYDLIEYEEYEQQAKEKINEIQKQLNKKKITKMEKLEVLKQNFKLKNYRYCAILLNEVMEDIQEYRDKDIKEIKEIDVKVGLELAKINENKTKREVVGSYYNNALDNFFQGNYKEAIKYCQKIAEIDEGNIQAEKLLAQIKKSQEKAGKEQKQIKKEIVYQEKVVEKIVYKDRVIYKPAAKEKDKKIADYNRVKINTLMAEATKNIFSGNYREAEKELREILKIEPGNKEARYKLNQITR